MNKHVYIDLLNESLHTHADLPCLHIKRNSTYTSWTYRSFRHDCNRLCAVLKKHGLKKGINAAVIGENSPEWIIAFHAIILTGACTVPIDPIFPPEEIESILVTTKARIVFCSKVYLDLMRAIQHKHGFLQRIILLETKSDEKEPIFGTYLDGDHGTKDAFLPIFEPNDPMVIIFTSGTTGKPKGVVLAQKNFSAVCNHAVPRMRLTRDDTVCAVLPLHHVFGCAASIIGPLAAGADIVFVPTVKGPLVLEALNDKAVTYLPAVPKMLQLFYDGIMHNIKKKGPIVMAFFSGLNSISAIFGTVLGQNFRRSLFCSVHNGFGGKLRLIISGGASLNKLYWNGFRRLGFTIVEGYGLTETFGPITVCPASVPRLGSVGPALDDNYLRIVDNDSSGIGEVYLKGTCVFSSYFDDPERTREVVDNDGWFHTGDLGRIDKDGYLYLSGRKKDMIVLDSGKNVYPDELEEYYSTSPLFEEIGVFGIIHNGKEIVAAAIVPTQSIRRSKSEKDATDIINHELLRLSKTMPVYRRISDFILSYNPLPRTTTRKLIKNELRILYHAKKRKLPVHGVSHEKLSVLEVAMMDSEEYTWILEDICRIAPKTDHKSITPRTNIINDIGLDSLDRIELMNSFEKRLPGSNIPDSLFDKLETMSDLVLLMKDLRSRI